eukprot:s5027_g4.t1
MLHVPDWFSCLLEHRPEVLLAGYSVEDEDLGRHLLAFWSAYRQEDPSHPIFQTHQGHLDACLPYFLFGDEGRGHRKSPVMIFAFEVVLGLRTKAVYEENMMTAPDLRGEAKALLAAQQHAAKLSSLKSRFLLAVLPHLWYKGKQVHVYRNTLDALSAKCKDLFHSGVQHRGKKFYGILLGVKGDSPALTKMGTLNRAYNRLGFDKGICPFCLGGKDNFPWEDMSSEAAWHSTIGKVRPWDTNCSNKLLDIPFSLDVPEFVFRVELRGTPHCKAFTRDGLHFDRETSYPWAGWKGSDTMLVLRWLVRLIRHGILTDAGSRSGNGLLAQPPGPEDLLEFQRDVLQAVLDGACAMIRFFQILNHTGAWLDSNAAHKVAFHVHMFCASYYFLAGRCQNKGLCRFHLEPSLHMFRHMGLRVQHLLDKGCQWILSPACFLAESSEDFVGQVARLARRTSARSTCTRTIQRYLIKCHFDYKDLTR